MLSSAVPQSEPKDAQRDIFTLSLLLSNSVREEYVILFQRVNLCVLLFAETISICHSQGDAYQINVDRLNLMTKICFLK